MVIAQYHIQAMSIDCYISSRLPICSLAFPQMKVRFIMNASIFANYEENISYKSMRHIGVFIQWKKRNSNTNTNRHIPITFTVLLASQYHRPVSAPVVNLLPHRSIGHYHVLCGLFHGFCGLGRKGHSPASLKYLWLLPAGAPPTTGLI